MLNIPEPQGATFYFVGVSTRQSSIMKIFPEWAKVWDLDASIEGIDVPINARPEIYRTIVHHMRKHPLVKGALVTTHKLDLYHAAHDLFDVLDPYAKRCGEVSCISKRDGKLIGHAKDPITSGLALMHFVPKEHWQTSHADVLCLGAGGAAAAISLYLAEQNDRPKQITMVDIDKERLNHVQAIHRTLETNVSFLYLRHSNAHENDALLEKLEPASLVINATGMGKDRPDSPLTDAAVFPEQALVWELNYRGSLDFFHQAKLQEQERGLRIEDGWVYFLHGWTQVIAEVFDRKLSPALFKRLDKIAAKYR